MFSLRQWNQIKAALKLWRMNPKAAEHPTLAPGFLVYPPLSPVEIEALMDTPTQWLVEECEWDFAHDPDDRYSEYAVRTELLFAGDASPVRVGGRELWRKADINEAIGRLAVKAQARAVKFNTRMKV